MTRLIYADNAATTRLDADAFEAMKPYLLDNYGNASQLYSFARPVKRALMQARADIAECIGAQPEEIYFTSGGTESDNWAIKGVSFADLTKQAIVTSVIEHHAVLRACEFVQLIGYPVVYLPVDKYGVVSVKSFEEMIPEKTRLVSIMYANNEIGSIQPIKQLVDIAHAHNAYFHTDAVQALGHINLNVNDLGIDLLSASAHKFNGPKGIGFLYIRSGTDISPHSHGGAQEFGMRAGTENIASIVGMAAALKKNCAEIEHRTVELHALSDRLLSILDQAGIAYVRNGSKDCIPGNISLSFPGQDGEALLHRLDLMGISVSTGAACDSKNNQVSHVLSAIGLPQDCARGTIRISFGCFNTIDDAVAIGNSLVKILSK